MSRRPKYSEYDFPPAGTVFAAPVIDGRFAAGRVLKRGVHGGAPGAMVAASPWLGSELPSLRLGAIREILHLNHHKWNNQPNLFWVHDPMPSDFIIVGQSRLSPDDLAASSDSFGGWQGIPIQALLQWRWDNDRGEPLTRSWTGEIKWILLRRESHADVYRVESAFIPKGGASVKEVHMLSFDGEKAAVIVVNDHWVISIEPDEPPDRD